MDLTSYVEKDKFITGIKYSNIFGIGLTLLILVIYLIIGFSLSNFPIDLVFFLIGGLLLTTAGCIGPGRYKKEYEVLLYEPRPGSSYSKTIPISGFTLNEGITEVEIMVNGHPVEKLKLKNKFGKISIDTKEIISETVNHIWLRYENKESNKSYFTLFKYRESMSDEEIDSLIEIEDQPPEKSIENAMKDYADSQTSGLGSIAIGVGFSAILYFVLGAILEYSLSKLVV